MAFNLNLMSKGEVFFISDTHFCHNKDFLYGSRGFSSIAEHDEKLVARWNSVVQSNDIVIHLGDLCLNDNIKAIDYIQQLNGLIYWIRGNHDTDNRVTEILNNCRNVIMFPDAPYAQIFKYNKYKFYCSHYPTISAYLDDEQFSQHLINLHGHIHTTDKWFISDNPFVYNVCVDAHNLAPINLQTVITDIKQRWEYLTQ